MDLQRFLWILGKGFPRFFSTKQVLSGISYSGLWAERWPLLLPGQESSGGPSLHLFKMSRLLNMASCWEKGVRILMSGRGARVLARFSELVRSLKCPKERGQQLWLLRLCPGAAPRERLCSLCHLANVVVVVDDEIPASFFDLDLLFCVF